MVVWLFPGHKPHSVSLPLLSLLCPETGFCENMPGKAGIRAVAPINSEKGRVFFNCPAKYSYDTFWAPYKCDIKGYNMKCNCFRAREMAERLVSQQRVVIYWFLLERNTIYFSVISKDGKSNPNFNPNLSLKSEKGIFSPKDLNRKTFRNLTLLSLLGVVSQKQLFKGAGSFLYTSQALYRRVLPPCMGREWGAPRKRTRTRVNWIEVFPGFLCRF